MNRENVLKSQTIMRIKRENSQLTREISRCIQQFNLINRTRISLVGLCRTLTTKLNAAQAIFDYIEKDIQPSNDVFNNCCCCFSTHCNVQIATCGHKYCIECIPKSFDPNNPHMRGRCFVCDRPISTINDAEYNRDDDSRYATEPPKSSNEA